MIPVIRTTCFMAALLVGATADAAITAAAGMPSADPVRVQLAENVDIGDIFLSEIERRLIRTYYDQHHAHHDRHHAHHHDGERKHLPPGLARKGWLPPGIYKQLVAGRYLPRDIVLHELPRELRTRLPHRAGERLYIADDKVLLVQVATNLILDVLTVAAIEALD